VRESRTLRLTWRGLETWPWWNCAPIPQSKERDWKPSTYSRRACPRPYLNGGDEETGLDRPRLVATQLGPLYGDAMEVLARTDRCPWQPSHPRHDSL
jgi:hypothetical protein